MPRWPLPPCLGALAQVAPPLRPLAPPCAPLQPFTVPQNPCAPSRTLAPPYRHMGLDCVTLEQAIGEGRAAELAPAELEAAEAVLEKARAAEKVKCEKDLREKMKATLTLTLALTLTLTCGLLPVAKLSMPISPSHGRRLTPSLFPPRAPFGPSLHPCRPSPHTRTTPPQAPHYSP